jgi:hypothetical protein
MLAYQRCGPRAFGLLRSDGARVGLCLEGSFCRLIVGLMLGMWAAPVMAQVGFDRPGGDYASFVDRSGDPAVCATRCDQDSHCRAWSFSYPMTEGHSAICWLKNQVPRSIATPCCVTGVRGAAIVPPRDQRVEISIDRPGGDYSSFETPPNPSGMDCVTSCQADTRCRAWTYVRPGYHGPAARCYLKDRITRPRTEPCCISGVVR